MVLGNDGDRPRPELTGGEIELEPGRGRGRGDV
jgi:hypothetical protein